MIIYFFTFKTQIFKDILHKLKFVPYSLSVIPNFKNYLKIAKT